MNAYKSLFQPIKDQRSEHIIAMIQFFQKVEKNNLLEKLNTATFDSFFLDD